MSLVMRKARGRLSVVNNEHDDVRHDHELLKRQASSGPPKREPVDYGIVYGSGR